MRAILELDSFFSLDDYGFSFSDLDLWVELVKLTITNCFNKKLAADKTYYKENLDLTYRI